MQETKKRNKTKQLSNSFLETFETPMKHTILKTADGYRYKKFEDEGQRFDIGSKVTFEDKNKTFEGTLLFVSGTLLFSISFSFKFYFMIFFNRN